MNTLCTIHGHSAAKVERVIKEMRDLGAPTIRVVDCGEYLVALEGVHRLEAAARLGIVPTLAILDQDAPVTADSLDWQDLRSGETYTAGELAAEAYSVGSGIYRLDGDGTLTLVRNGHHIPQD